jgi:AcrR family transcriptional regulator
MEAPERIIQKAHELFMRYGIRSVSMDDVATHLGISKKTIYHFFADKDALVEAVMDMEIAENQEESQCHKRQSDDAIHEIFLAMEMVLEIVSKVNPAVIFDLEKYHPKAFKKHMDFKNNYLYGVIKENLDWGKKEGLYREEIRSDIMSKFRLGSMFMIFDNDLFPQGKYNLTDIVTEMTDNFLYGLATTKGLKLIQKYKQIKTKTIIV